MFYAFNKTKNIWYNLFMNSSKQTKNNDNKTIKEVEIPKEILKNNENKQPKNTKTPRKVVKVIQRKKYFFYRENKIIKKKKTIDFSIRKQELDISKIEIAQKILFLLNQQTTSIALNGERGSGKTTVFTEAYEQFTPKKDFINQLTIILLYISLFIWTIIYSKNKISNISRRLSKRRVVLLNVNLWNIFGLRAEEDYNEKSVTASFVEKEVRSFIKESVKDDKDIKAKHTFLFVKKSIWKSVYGMLTSTRPTNDSIKSSLRNDSFQFDKNLNRKSIFSKFSFWIFMLFILIIPVVIFATLYNVVEDANKIVIAGVASGLFSLSSTILLSVIEAISSKETTVKTINEYLVDPAYNILIPKYLKKITKRKNVVLHFTELDRLHKWVSSYSKKSGQVLANQILETIGLMYTQNNFNIVVEIDNELAKIVLNTKDVIKENNDTNGNVPDSDHLEKLFSDILRVPYLDIKQLRKLILQEKPSISPKEKIIFSRNVRSIFAALISFSDKPSWRKKEQYINLILKEEISFIQINNIMIRAYKDYFRHIFSLVFNERPSQSNNNKEYTIGWHKNKFTFIDISGEVEKGDYNRNEITTLPRIVNMNNHGRINIPFSMLLNSEKELKNQEGFFELIERWDDGISIAFKNNVVRHIISQKGNENNAFLYLVNIKAAETLKWLCQNNDVFNEEFTHFELLVSAFDTVDKFFETLKTKQLNGIFSNVNTTEELNKRYVHSIVKWNKNPLNVEKFSTAKLWNMSPTSFEFKTEFIVESTNIEHFNIVLEYFANSKHKSDDNTNDKIAMYFKRCLDGKETEKDGKSILIKIKKQTPNIYKIMFAKYGI